jgi:hypothetical protein
MRVPAVRVVLRVVLSLVPSFLAAQEIPNWTVPPYGGARPAGELSTMADISPGIGFVAMQPCRVFDTRNANGPYGGPRLVGNTTRNFDIDSGPCTGIPTGVDAYSMNFGAILPDGANSFVTIWPTGSAQPLVSTINPIQGGVVANAAIVPAGTGGAISAFPNTGLHLYGDINGYFTDQYNPGVSFLAVSNNVAPAILGENTSAGAGAYAIQGVLTSTTPGGSSAAVRGISNGTSTSGHGVWGSHAGIGIGVLGTSANRYGVQGTVSGSVGTVGVRGLATAASGKTYGVYGQTDSTDLAAAGVFGVAGGATAGVESDSAAGVRGESRDGSGVLGLTEGFKGVGGSVINPANGLSFASGILGFADVGTNYGVFSFGPYGGNGAKYFVEPHPEKADMVIRFVSLEGNESGTYFRGKGKFQNGIATIEVPEDFRLVTDRENLSIQVTPIGDMATVAVRSIGLDRIVVRGSRNVEFFYTVNGVRKTHKHLTPIGPGREYMPETPDAKMPLYLTEGQKEMLISNGTYKPDGTVNMETAARLGWDKEWEKRERPGRQPTTE